MASRERQRLEHEPPFLVADAPGSPGRPPVADAPGSPWSSPVADAPGSPFCYLAVGDTFSTTGRSASHMEPFVLPKRAWRASGEKAAPRSCPLPLGPRQPNSRPLDTSQSRTVPSAPLERRRASGGVGHAADFAAVPASSVALCRLPRSTGADIRQHWRTRPGYRRVRTPLARSPCFLFPRSGATPYRPSGPRAAGWHGCSGPRAAKAAIVRRKGHAPQRGGRNENGRSSFQLSTSHNRVRPSMRPMRA